MSKRIRRRRYGGNVSVSLGDLAGALDSTVNSKDVGIGVVLGLAGVAAGKYAAKTFVPPAATDPAPVAGALPNTMSEWAALLAPVAGGAVVGAAALILEKKSTAGKGHMVGAVLAGVTVTAMELLASQLPAYFAGSVQVDLGVLVRDQMAQMGILMPDGMSGYGLLASDNGMLQGAGHMSELANFSMALDGDEAMDAMAGFAN